MKTPMICFPDSIFVNPGVFAISSLNIRTPTEPVHLHQSHLKPSKTSKTNESGSKMWSIPPGQRLPMCNRTKSLALSKKLERPSHFFSAPLGETLLAPEILSNARLWTFTAPCRPPFWCSLAHCIGFWLDLPRLRTPGTLAAELRPISQDILKMTPYKSKGHDDDSFQGFWQVCNFGFQNIIWNRWIPSIRLPHQIHQKILQFHDFSRSAKVSQSLQPCNLFPHYHQQTATAPDHNTKSPVVQSSFPQRYSATTKPPNAATWVAVVSNGNMWSLQSQPQMRFLPPEHISIISIISIISNNHKSNSKSRVLHGYSTMVLPPAALPNLEIKRSV